MAKTPPLLDLRAMSPYAWIRQERDRQDAKWGPVCDHHPDRYMSILTEELGEVAAALNKAGHEEGGRAHEEYHRELEYELIQVAAVAVKWIEAIRRGGLTAGTPVCPCSQCSKEENHGSEDIRKVGAGDGAGRGGDGPVEG